MDVGAVVRAAAAGDPRAWDRLVHQYSGLVWAAVRVHGLSVCDADDVSQTTWLRLAEHLPRLRDPDRVGLWLATTARNEALRVLRHRWREVPFNPLTPPSPARSAPTADVDLLLDERDRLLWQALRSVSPACQALLILLATEPELSYRDVSARLGIPVGSIGPTRYRCLERLRRHSSAMSAAGAWPPQPLPAWTAPRPGTTR